MIGYKARLKVFENVLTEDEINLKKLRTLCFEGIPEEKGFRSVCWKLLLNYLPSQRNTWSKTLSLQRNLYDQFIDEMIVTPGSGTDELSVSCDHPLSNNPNSQWNTYFRDNEVLLQIDKDVRRLHPEISFFQQPSQFPCHTVVNSGGRKRLHRRVQCSLLNSANVERKGLGPTKIALSIHKSIEDYSPLEEGCEAHWEVVERILFLYAKLNPGQGYVQGMNEIIGPIYYCFACDPNIEWKQHAEADCFFTFTNLMSEIRDFFIKSLDEAESGIGRLMMRLIEKLRFIDYSIYFHLTKLQLHPQYYSFRWLTLLLSQEFPLPDVLRIWDSLFADGDRSTFLIYICCAMIILIKDQLLVGDFSSNVKLLQNYPFVDIQIVLNKAVELSQKWLLCIESFPQRCHPQDRVFRLKFSQVNVSFLSPTPASIILVAVKNELNLKTEHRHCAACSEPITDKYLLQVSDQTWHVQCLRCCICQIVLEKQPSCFIKDDSIYCKQDYANLFCGRSFGAKCSKCLRVIISTDWIRKARDRVYHLACFACDSCNRQLTTGEEFALYEEKVLCKSHYLELVDGGTTSSDDGGDSEGYHSKNKAKRVRTTFTEEQLQVLQANFQLDSNPDGQDLERIAQITGLSKRVTQVWFQNSRARQKKHLHTSKIKPSSLSHNNSGITESNNYSRQINLHLTYSFQQHQQQLKTSPIYIPQHTASESSSLDELSQDSMLLCPMRGEGA